MIFVVLAALAVGGVGYYLKIYKPKRELDDAEDFDDLIAGEETVNEDEMEADAVPIPMDDDWDWGHEDKPDEPKRQDETVEPVEQDKPQGVLEESTRQDDAQGGPDDTVRQTWMKGEPDEPDEPDELARQNDEDPSNDSGVPDASERAADSQPLHLEREDYGVVELDESEDDDSEGNSLYM